MGGFGAEISVEKLNNQQFTDSEFEGLQKTNDELKKIFIDLKNSLGENYLFRLGKTKDSQSGTIVAINFVLSNHYGTKEDCNWHMEVELKRC
ncbi:hypothetical protein [Flavivirga eckloniae]|uniref:Uncharacterized protein n=1 Tax=Flavivirga eckloniae TaxID=1803846 RepID=A0A2K9PU12_9FLAO|nr:hypothetical protein [Flavivirga eckloniae]AUP80555.1 hypothetical protein C1H87_18285 [Flavivirga eckloniae]